MSTTQQKFLKNALKKIGASRSGRLSVRTARGKYAGKVNGRSQYEYGDAESHVDALTDEQIARLKGISEYIDIHNNKELNFAVIKY